ncbi:hypothetical protein LCGC14_3123010 [marine sediment metagenome]|uniref:Uncharacterized protein n=1 Tax=marine sediment metagenome TaxID=412755 RepID=A0A0F8YRI7_9ZZZZ
MSGTETLEFVGGPLDGRHDIVTPANAYEWKYQSRCAAPMRVTAEPEPISPYGPEVTTHVYCRRMRRRRKGNRWVHQDIWLCLELQ